MRGSPSTNKAKKSQDTAIVINFEAVYHEQRSASGALLLRSSESDPLFCCCPWLYPQLFSIKPKPERHLQSSLTGRLASDTFGQYVSGSVDTTLSQDVSNFTLATATSLELVYSEFKLISLLIDSVFEASGLESIPIESIAQPTSVGHVI